MRKMGFPASYLQLQATQGCQTCRADPGHYRSAGKDGREEEKTRPSLHPKIQTTSWKMENGIMYVLDIMKRIYFLKILK